MKFCALALFFLFRWKDVSRSECSSQCGSGVRQRIIKCMKEDLSMKNSHVVPEEHCKPLGPKPSLQEKCWGPCRNSTWTYSSWSECSVSCGKGVQHRSAECRNNKHQKEPDQHCNPNTKVVSQTCEERDCPDWGVGEWTDCSVTCGVGVRQRLYWCKQGDKYINERYCNGEKPVVTEVCSGYEKCYQWIHGEWAPCSSTCGDGFTEREVYCSSQNNEPQDPLHCEHLLRPPSMRNCSSGIACPWSETPRRNQDRIHPSGRILSDTNDISEFSRALWKAGEWSKCSVTCGEGFRRRTVTCHNSDDHSRLSLNYCDSRSKPTTSEKCTEKPCPQWHVGKWSECSVTCGRGARYRTVHCIYSDQQMQTEDACGLEKKPEVQEECIMEDCLRSEERYKWLSGPWSECSDSCGEGIQKRIVHCINEEGHLVNDELCLTAAPPRSQPCSLMPCPMWQWSEWTQCPRSCGVHEQNRYPHCFVANRMVPEDNCREAKPSPETRRCKIPVECSFRWRKGTWSQCHASCGLTYKYREVFCIDHERNRVSEEFCSSKRQPRNKKKCDLKPCPYAWKTTHWSECSASCDEGYKIRNVTCHAVNAYGWMHPELADSRHCDNSRKPRDIDRCNYGHCSSGFAWKPDAWQDCEGRCENAKQKRRLRCYSFDGHRVHNRNCDKTLKPKKKRKCSTSYDCPPKNCMDIQNFQNKRVNGDYQIQIRGKLVTVYCHNMDTAHPQEYISLPENLNFAVIHSSILSDHGPPDNCLRNNVMLTCDCNRKDTGFTIFVKIALNVTNLKVIIDDFTFSNTYYGKPVPFATAGDCVRDPSCINGQFSVSLKGTDFRVSSDTHWLSKANRGYVTINRLYDDQIITGKCGGYCDTCWPDPQNGFGLDIRVPA